MEMEAIHERRLLVGLPSMNEAILCPRNRDDTRISVQTRLAAYHDLMLG